MFNFIKENLHKIYHAVTTRMGSLFAMSRVDEATLQELEKILISADTGVQPTATIIKQLRQQQRHGLLTDGASLKQLLEQNLVQLLEQPPSIKNPHVILLVGVNGTGKTTLISKLAYLYAGQEKRVLAIAGDTFRAAATTQLAQWGDKLGITVHVGNAHQDPASVIYTGCQRFHDEKFDMLLVDTAGRLQTKTNLMRELEKIKNVLTKQLPGHTVCTLLTVDAMLGQNSLTQARLFHEATKLDGIALTKLDGTGKGGVVFAITQELHVPIFFLSFGEQPEQLKTFDARGYVQQLLG